MRSDVYLLRSIVEYCDLIEETKIRLGTDLEDFLGDRVYQTSIAFSLLQIGELVKRLSKELVTKYRDVEWSDIAGTRDVMAHRYHSINLCRQWTTINRDILPLRDYCSKILFELESDTSHDVK